MTSPTTRPDRRVTAPGPLLYLTEPARAVADFGLLTSSAPLLAALPRGERSPTAWSARRPMAPVPTAAAAASRGAYPLPKRPS